MAQEPQATPLVASQPSLLGRIKGWLSPKTPEEKALADVGVKATELDAALKAGLIDDIFVRLASSYSAGTSPQRGFPSKYFNIRDYTNGASLFQIRSSRFYSVESAIGRNYHSLIGTSVFGGVGLQLETPDELVNMAFTDWAKNMEVTGIQEWGGFLYECLKHVTRDGQCMVQPIVDGGHLYMSLLDVSQCARGYNDLRRRIYDGVEYDINWRPLAYYFVKQPDNGGYGRPRFALDRVSRDYQRVDAGSVVRVMWREFTGQTHGLPWLVASARHMDLLDEFQRLVIRRAANTTALNGYFERNPRDFDGLPDAGVTQLSPDSYLTIPQGSSFRTVNANFPESAYQVFTEAEARNVAMGGDISYFSLTQDLRAANYSSIRHAKQAEERVWGEIAMHLSAKLLDPIYQRWADHYGVMGPTQRARARIAARPPSVWVGPSSPFIDPGKEITYLTGQLKNRTMSPSHIMRSQGQNPQKMFEQIAEDIETMRVLGIPLPDYYLEGMVSGSSAQEPQEEPENDNDDGDSDQD